MAHEKLAFFFAVTVIGAAMIAAPALAASRGGGGGGGGRGMHGGAAFHGGGVSRGFSGRVGGVGIARSHIVANRAFFPRHRVFARSFVGYGAYAGYSCWRWVPTPFGLRQVWVCNYPYGSYY
jgi:hypothetical protein